eukprot:g713.t1
MTVKADKLSFAVGTLRAKYLSSKHAWACPGFGSVSDGIIDNGQDIFAKVRQHSSSPSEFLPKGQGHPSRCRRENGSEVLVLRLILIKHNSLYLLDPEASASNPM